MADAPNANDELYPIAVLIDELKVCDTALEVPIDQDRRTTDPSHSTTMSSSASMPFDVSPPSPSPWAPSALARS